LEILFNFILKCLFIGITLISRFCIRRIDRIWRHSFLSWLLWIIWLIRLGKMIWFSIRILVHLFRSSIQIIKWHIVDVRSSNICLILLLSFVFLLKVLFSNKIRVFRILKPIFCCLSSFDFVSIFKFLRMFLHTESNAFVNHKEKFTYHQNNHN